MLRTRKNALFPTSVCCWLIVLESCRITPPRMREKLIDALTIISKVRITPRMRGKHTGRKSADAALRITPAHAGKTPFRNLQNRGLSDHPRTCGENQFCHVKIGQSFGSPPHMRGKQFIASVPNCLLRITPAHAGKTAFLSAVHWPASDHPRTCGENRLISASSPALSGSPPHMRGKRDKFKQYVGSLRITPAHAGKTSQVHRWHSRRPDHPRTCGENIKKEDLMRQVDGSPPHMRGKLFALPSLIECPRITPAHAGKTLKKKT